MLELLDRHSYIAITLAILLEELGVPMPIPTDLLIIFAGVHSNMVTSRLLLWFVLLNIASATGASGLYAIVRRGGRPLLERYGRYIHLGPDKLDRAERLLSRGGWLSIAIGRAVPGLRYLAVIACGMLKIPYLRFLTAHIVGSSVYIAAFLALGAVFGPAVVDNIHLPRIELRLIWLLLLAIGLPLLLAFLSYRSHAEYTVPPSRRRTFGAILLASFAGATSMAAAWAAAAALSVMFGPPRPLNVILTLANALLGRGLRAPTASAIVYASLLILCIVIGELFYEIILPVIAKRGTSLLKQALGLVVLCVALVSSFLVPALVASRNGPFDQWWKAGGPFLGIALLLGIFCFAFTTAMARALAIATLPSRRRVEAPTPETPSESTSPVSPSGTESLP